jgi:predicted dehydrogenase
MGNNIAVIGLRHGERHVHGFLAAGAQKIYAVDINEALYKHVQDQRVVCSSDYLSVLPLADMIVISLPPALHAQALEAALKTNAKRIWIEKPLLDIGEDPNNIRADERVEVIHELRRSQVVKDWIFGSDSVYEVQLSWRRPVPLQYNPERHPIGVVHDLGAHLVDLSFALLRTSELPQVVDVNLSTLTTAGAQEVSVALRFGDVPVAITAGWVADEHWPDKEITVNAKTTAGSLSWYGRKSSHRHLTDGLEPTNEQITREKDWYVAALHGEPTCFTPMAIATRVQVVCNDVVRLALEETS